MRYAALVAILFLLIPPAGASTTPEIDPRASLGVVQQWIYNYRAKPDYAHVPPAVRVLFHAQSFKETENSRIYLGLIAGAIGSNPAKAEQLVTSFFPVAPEDEWVIVRAIAYSGLPDWRNLLRQVGPGMHGRKEAEDDADLRRQSGPAGYVVGILFRDRLAPSDSAHHANAALEQEP